MKVSELGEFGLIELLSEVVTQKGLNRQLLVSIGDDAAAWRGDDSTILATTDTLVQGVHFTPEDPWRELGWKALAINLSDIAAMGGLPQYALVSLSFPGDTEVGNVVQLYNGMAEAAKHFNVAIAGGNISNAPAVVFTIAVIGQAKGNTILTRSAAIPGDLIAVTGHLGSSAAGRRMLSQHLQFDPETMDLLRKAHLQPQPRIVEGQLLVALGGRAAIDISDGLVSDLVHICKASKVEAKVNLDQVPIHPLMEAVFPEESLSFALAGGEDYELLFAASHEVIERLRQDCSITVIGEITRGEPGKVTLMDREGKPLSWDQKGWEHFKSGLKH